ncbi:MAG: hypothetical protein JRH18_12480 [Deltaproteobacteria bacterium]|nr:hypothetical protein [Deltaproteobacteria bacterium]MBW1994886.1 hypothetical protein [Deltaproteobacteria bacterium]MBW2152473.1 hypothetical protein [Deltaproteobacteria bacterium]
MKFFRIATNGFVLCAANLMAITVGFSASHFFKPANQLAAQLSIAAILSFILFLIWGFFLRIPLFRFIALQSYRDHAWVFIASLAWGPVALFSIRFVIRGYVPGMGNVMTLFLFQLPVNLLVLIVVRKTTGRIFFRKQHNN